MTTSKPNVDPEVLYGVTQAARALEIHRTTVRDYAIQGLIKFRIRKAGRRPVTTGAEIIKCWRAMYL